MDGEPDFREPEGTVRIHLVHIPPCAGDNERARQLVEEDRGKQELTVW